MTTKYTVTLLIVLTSAFFSGCGTTSAADSTTVPSHGISILKDTLVENESQVYKIDDKLYKVIILDVDSFHNSVEIQIYDKGEGESQRMFLTAGDEGMPGHILDGWWRVEDILYTNQANLVAFTVTV